MRYTLLLILFFSASAYAQTSKQYDTITDPAIAVQKLHFAISKDVTNSELYYLIGQRKFYLQEYDSCIFYSNKSIELLTKFKNNKILIQALHIKGSAQYYLDDKIKAETNWRQALQVAMQENEFEKISKLATNIGAIYLDRAYLKDRNSQLFNIADSFFAISYNKLKAKDSLGSAHGLLTQRLMATSLQFQKKYDSANYYYKKVIELSKTKNPAAYLGALTFYAESLSETGRHDEAIAYIKEAANFAMDSNVATKDKTHVMHLYGRVLNNSGNFQSAYKFNDSAYQLLASDYQKINAQAYAESESKFKNQILQYQIEVEQQKKNQLYYLVAGLIILAAFVFLWLQNRNHKRIAREKSRQKQISIDAFIEGEEKEKARIGRELHDGIAQEIVGVKLAMHQQHADPKLIDELTRISLDIRNISHELMPLTLKEYGLKLAIEDICQKILAPSGIQYEIHSSLPDERMANKIEITLYRIFQELAHNIIKHSHATEVLVQLRKMNNHILLVVEDNGKGMTEEKKNGIGISNLTSRVQLLDGNLQYDSSDNEGTTAIVRVPV
ncbi:MAG: sensor histidine kinase [Chitinophagaceae bacterium]|nr:sensor histidine kinase [Chitinophagaceae bacterium]